MNIFTAVKYCCILHGRVFVMLKAGGDGVIGILTKVCNKIFMTREWPTEWTKSIIITPPKQIEKTCSYSQTR